MNHQILPPRSVSSIAHGAPERDEECSIQQPTRGRGRRIVTSLVAVIAFQVALAPPISAQTQPTSAAPVHCEPGDGSYGSGCRLNSGLADGWYVPQSLQQGSSTAAARLPHNAR